MITYRNIVLALFCLNVTAFSGEKPWLPDTSPTPYEKPVKATYYVDYENGSDSASGKSPEKALKHCPDHLEPSDTVIFKGGVAYEGTITVSAAGTEEKPIVLDGNTAGTFGDGPAIIEGGIPVSGWRLCTSKEEARGNPLWEKIFVAEVPVFKDWHDLNLSSLGEKLAVAQDPNPSDLSFQENLDEYFHTTNAMKHLAPCKVYLEPGTHGNSGRPIIQVLPPKKVSGVVSPVIGAAFSLELDEPEPVTKVGIMMQPKYTPVKEALFLADGEELLKVELQKDINELQVFDLPKPVSFKKLTIRFLSVHGEVKNDWTAIAMVGAFTKDGRNLFDADLSTMITDPANLTATAADAYDGMTVAFHAGNNFVFYSPVKGFDPETGTLSIPFTSQRLYKESRYSLFNSVKLIDQSGEYAVEPTKDGSKWNLFYLPQTLQNNLPAPVAYSGNREGFTVNQSEHVAIQGFCIRRQGGEQGVTIRDSKHVTVRDCEITLVRAGSALYAISSDSIMVDGCHIHDCPGHTKGIVLQKSTNVSTRRCWLDNNTSTGLDYYTCTDGDMTGNLVTRHAGMHANGLTLYLGCKNILVESNYVTEGNCALTFQEAENMTFRNNVLDGSGRSTVVGIWNSQPLKNCRIIGNTIVRGVKDSDWQVGLFTNNKAIEGLEIRDNIIDGTCGRLPAAYSGNIYTRNITSEPINAEAGERLVTDLNELFIDPAAGDFRRKPGIAAGAALRGE
jgi:hypothetical protein